ncbi:amino acid adenylation domain-containing protein [Nocardiopsis sp. CNT-189]|uniref:amino acid adenylation domain-containing protein n=1 Tax=Nocardiopsis oceanisediminis TaxID=2816862 RepID=UPI003B37CD17
MTRATRIHSPSPSPDPPPPAAPVLPDLLSRAAAAHPHLPALADGARRYDHRRLDAAAARIADRLHRLGIARGDRVAVLGPRDARLIALLHGVLRSGAAAVPVDPGWSAADTERRLRTVQAALALTADDAAPAPAACPTETVDLDAEEAAHAGAPGEPPPGAGPRPQDPAYLSFTSGSNGEPKAVAVTHANAAHYALSLRRRLGWGEAEAPRIAHVTTLAADLGHTSWLLAPVTAGSVQVLPDRLVRDPEGFWAELHRTGVSVLKTTPSHLAALLEGRPPGAPALRALILGGETLTRSLAARLLDEGVAERVANHYGPTETTIGAACFLAGASAELPEDEATVPIGTAIGGGALHLLDAAGEPVPDGAAGELHIGGRGVSAGYHGRPEETGRRFFDHRGERVYRTGDLCRRRPEGDLVFLGRADRQVKIRGFRVDLAGVERAIEEFPGVGRAAVVLRTTPAGARPAAAVRLTDGRAEEDALAALRAHLHDRLPEYAVPRPLLALRELPLGPNGKVDAERLGAIVDGALEERAFRPEAERGAGPGGADREPTARAIARLWADALGLPGVDPHADVLELGGDSILAMYTIAFLRRRGHTAAFDDFYRNPTPSGLAAAVHEARPAERPAAPVRSGEARPAPAQRWLFRTVPDPRHWNQSALLACGVRVDPAALSAAVREVLRRHPALRRPIGPQGPGEPRPAEDLEAVTFSPVRGAADAVAETVEGTCAELHRALDPESGLLLRVHLFSGGPGVRDRIALIAHHLAVDGVSWRILLDDLAAAYRAALRGEEAGLPPTADFYRWAADRPPTPDPADAAPQASDPADGAPAEGATVAPAPAVGASGTSGPADGASAAPGQADGTPAVPGPADGATAAPAPADGASAAPGQADGTPAVPGPADGAPGAAAAAGPALPVEGAGGDPEPAALVWELGADATARLTARHGRGQRLEAVLLSAFAAAVADRTGLDAVGIEVETHGRGAAQGGGDHPDTVGWFTAVKRVLLERGTGDRARAAERAVREAPELPMDTPGPRPETGFNFLGAFNPPDEPALEWTPAREHAGTARPPAGDLLQRLRMTARIVGGRLVADLVYAWPGTSHPGADRIMAAFAAAVAAEAGAEAPAHARSGASTSGQVMLTGPARRPPPPSTEALRAADSSARRPPPPSTEALRAADSSARRPPPPSTEALRAADPSARRPPPPSTEALRAADSSARRPQPSSDEVFGGAVRPARRAQGPSSEGLRAADRSARRSQASSEEALGGADLSARRPPPSSDEALRAAGPSGRPRAAHQAVREAPRVLLTGATGYLGGHLLDALTERGARVTCLVRGERDADAARRIGGVRAGTDAVAGDIDREGLGLSPEALAGLRDVQCVVHAAADVRLVAPPAELERTNTAAVRRLLAWIDAEIPGAALHHLSTLAVSGAVDGPPRRFAEVDLRIGQSFRTPYERTKFEAEEAVRAWAASGRRCYVHRSGHVAAHSRTGAFQHNIADNRVYQLIRGYVLAGAAPRRPEEEFAFSHADTVAAGIAALALHPHAAPGAYHVETPHTVPHDELVAWTAAFGYPIELTGDDGFAAATARAERTRPVEARLAAAWSQAAARNVAVDRSRTVSALERLGVRFAPPTPQWWGSALSWAVGAGFLPPPEGSGRRRRPPGAGHRR